MDISRQAILQHARPSIPTSMLSTTRLEYHISTCAVEAVKAMHTPLFLCLDLGETASPSATIRMVAPVSPIIKVLLKEMVLDSVY